MRDSPLAVISEVVTASSGDELQARMQAAARSLGFEHALFGVQIVRPHLDPLVHVSSAYPQPYQQLYAEREFVTRDPTVGFCQANTTPLIWSEEMYSEPSFEIMEESRRFGLAHGISVPVHESANSKSMLSLARDKPFDPGEALALAQGALVLANCLHVATARLVIPDLLALKAPKLTRREIEVLKWAAEGKSASVIADLLNVSQSAVNFHTMNVYRKLNVATRLQAVSKAFALGLIG